MRLSADMSGNVGMTTSLSWIRSYNNVLNQCMNVLRESLLLYLRVAECQRHHIHHSDHYCIHKCTNIMYTVILAYIYVDMGKYAIHNKCTFYIHSQNV